MARKSPLSFELRAIFGRPALRHVAREPVAGWDTLPTAANSRIAGSTAAWEDARLDPLVGDAVQFAEQRLALADDIALELMMRPQVADAPELVQHFLLRVWPLVVAHARLLDATHDEDPGGYLALVDDLLWSVRRDATLRRPSRAARIIPGLLQRLREGVRLLGEVPADTQSFFDALERLHQPVLRLCAARRQEASLGEAPPPQAAPALATPLEGLATGSWVDLYAGQGWIRARVQWVDPQGRQFLFVGEHGRMHTMTRRILERLVHEGLLRLAAPSPSARTA